MSEDGQVMTETEITRLATAHMGHMAWPTVLLAIASVLGYAALFVLVVNGSLPLLAAFLIASYLVYAIYTPLHEAVHKNICGRRRDLIWLNDLIGYLAASVLGVSYKMHRSAHMTHHRATNVKGQDPDFVTSGRSPLAVLGCGVKMVTSEYRDYFSEVFPRASRRERTIVIAEIALFIGWRLALVAGGFGIEVLVLAVLANIAGVTLLGFLFAWAVHAPFDETERYRNTTTILLPPAIHGLLTRLWLWQNYHSIHHLFPKVPYYRYSDLFADIRPGMEERGAPVVLVGG